ncbi:MAG: hypothetical protein DYG92_14260 [Leptolyngbya sp. PLA1]|nr:hypothetical protein [Leptolyngbya sp. PLA1]
MTRAALAVLSLSILSGVAVAEPAFTRIVVFGDSLSDTGNTRALGLSRPENPFYSNGRWTNDRENTAIPRMNMQTASFTGVWHERLADLIIGPGGRAINSRAGGARATNYAYGGATTAEGIVTRRVLGRDIEIGRNMGTQVRDYVSTLGAGGAPVDNLYVLWGGGNDLRDRAMAPRPTAEALAATARTAVSNIESQIRLLSDHVPRGREITVLWPNVPPLELTPEGRALPAAARTALADATALFKSEQLHAFNRLKEAAPNVVVRTMDVHGMFDQLVRGRLWWNPGDTTRNIVSAGDFSAAFFNPQRNPAVAGRINPDDYVFWDQLHPTSRVHFLLGSYAQHMVPAPGCGALILAGVCCLGGRRRAA